MKVEIEPILEALRRERRKLVAEAARLELRLAIFEEAVRIVQESRKGEASRGRSVETRAPGSSRGSRVPS